MLQLQRNMASLLLLFTIKTLAAVCFKWLYSLYSQYILLMQRHCCVSHPLQRTQTPLYVFGRLEVLRERTV